MYVPEERVLRLVEIQESVLPEEEWIIGVSDLGYFKGVGFSMPLAFGEDPFDEEDLLMVEGDDKHFQLINKGDKILHPVERTEIDDDPLLEYATNMELEVISSSDSIERDGVHPDILDEYDLVVSMEQDLSKGNLYAFLPGLFYCSSHHASVDAILVEVTQRDIFGMTLPSFRPEDVRSFDVSKGIVVDEEGKTKTVEMSTDTLGKFTIDISSEIAESAMEIAGEVTSMGEVTGTQEIEVALALADRIPVQDLKEAYVSGAILAGKLMTLMHDIETKGLRLRNRIYVRNERFPNGKIISVNYGILHSIIELCSRPGIDCPQEVDLGMELRRLSFTRLVGAGKEVDVEEAILDLFRLLQQEFGSNATKDQILRLLFSGGNQ
ncbi:MAG: hypothetical protein BAJATHORv1_30353 [Candidatus Thorarchaeota archaeon]|nr:MAG: hypothetical protein BAJATHORv1_30353 [Candidatus Thorarchaeota archaeon]